MLTDFFDAYTTAYKPYKDGRWCYEDGLIYRGLELLHKTTGESRWLDHIKQRVDAQITQDSKLVGYDQSDYNIDNIMSGRALMYLYETTGDARYLATAETLVDQLSTHPRTNSGVYWHKLRYPWQVWLDGLYMGLPFQISYGLKTENAALVEDALQQLDKALVMTFVPATGLYCHAVDEARKQRWANPETGQSPAHWARSLGWLAMALVDVAELVGEKRFAPLRARAEVFLANVLRLRGADGLWLQVIDQPELAENYKETSASAMFVYGLLKGRALGLVPDQTTDFFGPLGDFAVKPKSGGGFEMVEICEVAGLGPFENRYRDGSAEYYLSERVVADDAKGVGPMMMSYAASLQAESVPVSANVG